MFADKVYKSNIVEFEFESNSAGANPTSMMAPRRLYDVDRGTPFTITKTT